MMNSNAWMLATSSIPADMDDEGLRRHMEAYHQYELTATLDGMDIPPIAHEWSVSGDKLVLRSASEVAMGEFHGDEADDDG